MDEFNSELEMHLDADGEMIIRFPDGTKLKTEIFPSKEEFGIIQYFSKTTSGKSLLMKMRNREIHDDLTDLLLRSPAKAIIQKHLDRLAKIRYCGIASVLLFDLDHFGKINKEFGITVGDEILKWFADILRLSTRSNDVVARWGGEEFVVFAVCNQSTQERERANNTHKKDKFRDTAIFQTFNESSELEQFFNSGHIIAKRVVDSMKQRIFLHNQHTIKQTVTIGVASSLITPDHHLSPKLFDDLFERADKELRNAKTSGKRDSISQSPLYFPSSVSSI